MRNPTAKPKPKKAIPTGLKLRYTLRGHDDFIVGVAWSPQSQVLASTSFDSTIRKWNVGSGKQADVLRGHSGNVYSVAWSPDGKALVSGGGDGTVRIWAADKRRELVGHLADVTSVAWSPDGRMIASGGGTVDRTVRVWDAQTGRWRLTFVEHQGCLNSLAWSPDGQRIASGSDDTTILVWDAASGAVIHSLKGHTGYVLSVAWSPDGRVIASGSSDKTIRLWDAATGRQTNVLETHTGYVKGIAFSAQSKLLASKAGDDTVRLWRTDTWVEVALLAEPGSSGLWRHLAFHPVFPILATLGEKDRVVRIWDLDRKLLLRDRPKPKSVRHTTAKVVLVGDSGVGKTSLGWRLAHGVFKEHASTHGQQFWVMDSMKTKRKDGTECEAVLWDLAGQPDYRLIHGLFLDDVDLALVLFNPADRNNPLSGVDFWLKALAHKPGRPCRIILVGARIDRGMPTLTKEEIDAFCRDRGISGGYIPTSALRSDGIDELIAQMKAQIVWEEMITTTTTTTFKRIKQYVLDLKESDRVLTTPQTLRKRLQALNARWSFDDEEMMTALDHLAKHGYVRVLRTASGKPSILLAASLLNNLAASLVLAARSNEKGLGALDEEKLLGGGHRFDELTGLRKEDKAILLEAATLLFLEHNICFRETPEHTTFLVFPELINLKKPELSQQEPPEDDFSYVVTGAVENVYAALVVQLGYTSQFTRSNQWRHEAQYHAQYEFSRGEVCGFRQTDEREGEIDLVLYYGLTVEAHTRQIFQGLFERFLGERDVEVIRFPPQHCPRCGERQYRKLLVERTRASKSAIWCHNCGKKINLSPAGAPDAQLGPEEKAVVAQEEATVAQRTQFEQAIFQIKKQFGVEEPPDCFISYAWGNSKKQKQYERWVEDRLATDLKNAGIKVILARWHNPLGARIDRFIEESVDKAQFIIVVGTPSYGRKYEKDAGAVVGPEIELINQRLMGPEKQKETVFPILLGGYPKKSFPPLLRGRVHADFRKENNYLTNLFNLILSLYGIPFDDETVIDLQRSLRTEHVLER